MDVKKFGPPIAITLTCCFIYLALRPPLFDFDGYLNRLDALGPHAAEKVHAYHLLWAWIQMAIRSAAVAAGHPTTVPFQIVGIALNCLTLLALWLLLHRISGNRWFAGI